MARILHWLAALVRSWRSHPSRQLYLRETLALGERRFIAVVEFERQKFLIAGTGSSVAMLTALNQLGVKKSDLVKYATSADVSGDRDAVVGYAGMIFS